MKSANTHADYGTTSKARIISLTAELRSKDGIRREHARKALVTLGSVSTPALLELLSDRDTQTRWEACKALGSIQDPSAGPRLARALSDEDEEVRWLAAEALIRLKRDALIPIMRALIHDFHSPFLRQGAYHVLHVLEREHLLTAKTRTVLTALRSLSLRTSVASAAYAALRSLLENNANTTQ